MTDTRPPELPANVAAECAAVLDIDPDKYAW
jgi:hypothetical protein